MTSDVIIRPVTSDLKLARHARLLLVAASRWHDTARLALAARQAGFEVHLLGPKEHPVASLAWVHAEIPYSTLRPTSSIARALNDSAFDVVVPVDDVAAAALFASYPDGRLNESARSLIRRSLGDPETFGIRHARAAVGEIAARNQLRAPLTWPVPDEGALRDLAQATVFPAVVKSDVSTSGRGVIMVADLDSARAAYSELSRLPGPKSSLGSALFDGDAGPIRRRVQSRRDAVSVQEFVEGEPATLSALAWEGEVVGQIGLRVVRARYTHGPATVVEPLEHPDMSRAAAVVARRLGLSGFFGLDFILSPDRSTASMLELNPRATPTSCLHLGSLQRPLFHLLGDCIGLRTPVRDSPLPDGFIAMFPHGKPTDRSSAVGVHLDIPDAEDVVALCESEYAAFAPKPLGRTTGPVVRALRRLF